MCVCVCVCAALDYYFIMSAAGKMEGCCVPKDLSLDTVQKGGKMKFLFIFISVSPSISLSSSAFFPLCLAFVLSLISVHKRVPPDRFVHIFRDKSDPGWWITVRLLSVCVSECKDL